MEEEQQPQNINGFLGAFVTMISTELPEEEPGVQAISELLSVMVNTQNKRKIQLLIRTKPDEVLRVTYVMPVHKSYSQLFEPRVPQHVIPHEDPTFSRFPAPPPPEAGFAPWADEIARVRALEVQESAANPAAVRARAMRALLAYWGNCRTQILGLLSGIDIRSADAIVAVAAAPADGSEPRTVSEDESEWLDFAAAGFPPSEPSPSESSSEEAAAVAAPAERSTNANTDPAAAVSSEVPAHPPPQSPPAANAATNPTGLIGGGRKYRRTRKFKLRRRLTRARV
jgi:hypothetical protein